MRALTVLLLSLVVAACTLAYNPRYYYNNIVVANLSGETLRNLRVRVGPAGRKLECAQVTDRQICQVYFGKRPYPRELVEISWQDSKGEQVMRQLNVPVPVTLTAALAIRLLLDIEASGAVRGYVKQDDFRLGHLPRLRARPVG